MAGRIEDYAIIGDMQSAALVSTDGSIDWLCLPRFDSPACFAALLGDDRHGSWQLAAAEPGSRHTRRYQGDTLILETEWRTSTGTARVIDFMPRREDGAPVLVRMVEGVHGSVQMDSVLRIRFEYGRVVPWARRVGHAINAVAGPDSLWITSPVPMDGKDMAHRATFTVTAGQRIPFTLTWVPSHHGPPPSCDADDALEETIRFWAGWTSRCTYQGQYRDAVIRSLITLKALTYEPTGGVVAAPTTSLPEDIGGSRNWDYRYCWLRDATITLEALIRTGYTEEATAWQQWLSRAIAGDPADVQIMYGVAGERRLAEWEADWLPGYEGSAPVRIGNAAVQQRQLDVYGEVVDALCLAARSGIPADRHTWSLQRSLLSFLEKHWAEPDEGIWEVRGPRRHFVHSKVMAWVGFDRAVTATGIGLPGPAGRWRTLRDQIRAEVVEKGDNAERGAFTQYYGSQTLDASVLLMAGTGFLPPDDPKLVATVEAISRDLVTDGLVRRYQLSAGGESAVDGLPGSEGAFLACSFWLADALHMTGRPDDAVELFERLLGLRNDVGLLSEE
jgi:GH15 family glucan-1,4-alpha-glucosidase